MTCYTAKYAAKVGSRVVCFWVRPEHAENTPEHATLFLSEETACDAISDIAARIGPAFRGHEVIPVNR